MTTLASNSAMSSQSQPASGLQTPRKAWLFGAVILAYLLFIGINGNLSSLLSRRDEGLTLDASGSVLPKDGQPVVAQQIFKELSPADAEAKNDQRPLANRPLEVAAPFVFPHGSASPIEWDRAVECLALANYYEAASEGPQGMRAVSQVVLNRVRHPAFPKSVCEVVFQGADRQTGCQFTFTCDGSLARAPIPALMARARTIAAEALHGQVEASVGMATHYHTRQVVPYWSDGLDKVRVLGAHIFYVWQGSWGNKAAFRGRYIGEPSSIGDRFLSSAQLAALPTIAPEPVVTGFDNGPRSAEGLATSRPAPKRTFLVADESKRALKIDDNAGSGLMARPLSHLLDERPSPLSK